MAAEFNDPRVSFHIGDVRDEQAIEDSFRTVGIDVVVHAAAMKRVEACQANPDEARKTNIQGTAHVCRQARLVGIPKVLVISSDKACEPVTVYGATKAAAESEALGANALAGNSGTNVSVLRYGNCYDSAGAVFHAFRRAKSQGTPMRLTDPAMSRFWWRVSEAAAYVVAVSERMQGAEIWVPKLGAATIQDLAYAVWPEAPVEVIGLRGTEKLHEVMVSSDEARYAWEVADSYVLLPHGGSPPVGAVRVPAGFRFASDTAPRADLRGLAA